MRRLETTNRRWFSGSLGNSGALTTCSRGALAAVLVVTLVACGDKKTDAPTSGSNQPQSTSATAKASASAAPTNAPDSANKPAKGKTADGAASGSAAATPLSAVASSALAALHAPVSNATISVEGASFEAGKPIEVKFSKELTPPETEKYWITLVKADAPDSEFGNWHYVASGASSETLTPSKEGDYEIRLHDLYPQNPYKVMSRVKVSVTCAGGNCGPAVEAPPPPPKPTAGADGYLPDGWPADIPKGTSKPPTTEEWNALTKEVTVWHSSDLSCETKVIREWLRVSCHKNFWGAPTGVDPTSNSGQQHFEFTSAEVASCVVAVVEGKTFTAHYSWEGGSAEFFLSWPQGGRPESYFAVGGD